MINYLLYSYLGASFVWALYMLGTLIYEDILMDRDPCRRLSSKFGYNFKTGSGKDKHFCINSTVWICLFPTLPIINLIWFVFFVVPYFIKLTLPTMGFFKEEPVKRVLFSEEVNSRIIAEIVSLGNGREDVYISTSVSRKDVVFTEDVTNISRAVERCFPKEYSVCKEGEITKFTATILSLNKNLRLIVVRFNEIKEERIYCADTFGLFDPDRKGYTDINMKYTLPQQVYEYIDAGVVPYDPAPNYLTTGAFNG